MRSVRSVGGSAGSDASCGRQAWTPLEDIPGAVAAMRSHRFGIPLEKRFELLSNLHKMLVDEKVRILDAEFQDLRRPRHYGENVLNGCVASTALARDKLYEWTQPKPCALPAVGPCAGALGSGVRFEPKGVALVIGTWNFPIPLVIKPLASAIAAGCPVVVKLNELCEQTSAVLQELLERYLDPAYVRCVYGGVPQATALLEQRFGVIFYTGNTSVGKVIYKAAAEHLTPCILELGGKNPVFVTKHANVKNAAWKLVDTKFQNVGQFCVSPDHVFLDPEVDAMVFRRELVAAARSFFGENPQRSSSLSRLINRHHYDRVRAFLEEDHGGEVLLGGVADCDASDLYIPPTVIMNPRLDCLLLSDEIFGPILPIVTCPLEEALAFVDQKPDPLALYIFSEDDATTEHILSNTRSGGVAVNDCIQQMLNETLPFGGRGASGFGNYHGEWGFKAFSHERAFIKFAAEDLPKARFAPYG